MSDGSLHSNLAAPVATPPCLRSTEIKSLQSLCEVLISTASTGACVEVVLNAGAEPVSKDRVSPHVWFDEFQSELGPGDKRLWSKIIAFAKARCMFQSFMLRLVTKEMFLHLSSARLAEALHGLTPAQAEHRLRGLSAEPLDNALARDCPLMRMRGVIIGDPSPSQVVELRLTPADFVSRVIGQNVDKVRLHELGSVLVCKEASHYWFAQPHPASPRVPSFNSLIALHESKGVKFLELFRVPDASSDSDASDSENVRDTTTTTEPQPAAQEQQFRPAAQRQICKAWVVARDTRVVIDALPQPDPLTGSLGAGPTKQQLELILLEMRAKSVYSAPLFKDEFADYDPSEKNQPEEFKEYEKVRNERASLEGLLRPLSHELKARVAAYRNQGYLLYLCLSHTVDSTPDFVLRVERWEKVIDRELKRDEAATNKRRRLDQ